MCMGDANHRLAKNLVAKFESSSASLRAGAEAKSIHGETMSGSRSPIWLAPVVRAAPVGITSNQLSPTHATRPEDVKLVAATRPNARAPT